ncbi:hypothetical protein HMPREF0322_03504 [Desulfitobacterium hafniense DP7]|uniref:Uncharacterized protein n=1 Tax=Desulfitobacterium hafniense DP7 TaxID=537010 RepID=G9XRA6_DESHA|nr:hypothetical protein HMPREF0322_03504 [Desulfitobacterium hafniense DP7]
MVDNLEHFLRNVQMSAVFFAYLRCIGLEFLSQCCIGLKADL